MNETRPAQGTSSRIKPSTRKWLEEQWLPEIRAIPERRRPMKRLLMAIAIGPLAFVIVWVCFLLMSGTDFHLKQGAVLTSMVGLSVGSIVFLGKLQSCDDQIPQIALAVGLNDEQMLRNSISQLGCYSGFRRHLELLRKAFTPDV